MVPDTCSKNKFAVIILVMAAALVILFLVSFALGLYPIPVDQVVGIIAARLLAGVTWLLEQLRHLLNLIPFVNIDSMPAPYIEPWWTERTELVVMNVRLPRILLSCLVGCSLSAAGAVYQGIFQNPMASSDILGASKGAAFGAALCIWLGASTRMISLGAFVMALAAVGLVGLVGAKAKGKQVLTLVLTGIMISSLFDAGTSFIKLVADPTNQLPAITYWLLGSLSAAKMADVQFVILPMLLGLVPLMLLRWHLNVLTMGDDEARTMGINARVVRPVVIVAATLITAAAVSVSGVIGWISLVIPHIARRLVGNNYRYLMPASMLLGALFLLIVDNISRNLMATEIPLGILTALVGAPFFLYLILKGGEGA